MDETKRRPDGTMDETNRTTAPAPSTPGPESGPAASGAGVLADKARVLVVDDELGIRRSLERLLVAKGFEVATSEDGEAALRKLTTWPADVVLVDLIMPRLGGMDL